MNPRALRGGLTAALLFFLVQAGALALVPTFDAQGYQQVPNPQDPTNSLVYVGAILVATAVMLAAFKFDLDWVVKAFVVATGGLLAWYVLGAVLPAALAGVLAAGVAGALVAYPEWYVVDAAGVVMGAGAGGLFGISFGVLPAVLLLGVLAVYDAISVYGTEHMLDLAEGVMDLRVPVVLVIPLQTGYSFLADGSAASDDETPQAATDGAGDADADPDSEPAATPSEDDPTAEREAVADRDAFFIGLGDAVMPTVLVASAAFFAPAPSLGVPLLPALNLPALGAMVGTFLGLAVLLRWVFRGRAHAGLPLLNGGAIAGYLLGAVASGLSLVTALGLERYL
ncbi:MAG: presenilin family intramembrane aspartyl protease PSH [Halolamina sp.]